MTRSLHDLLLVISIVAIIGTSCRKHSPRPLSKTATLEVYEVVPQSGANCRAIFDPDSKSQIYLKMPPIVTSADVATVQRQDERQQDPALIVDLTPQGAQKLAAATTPAKGQKLAIVVNGQVAGVPSVRTPVSSGFSISGGAFHKEREDIFGALTED